MIGMEIRQVIVGIPAHHVDLLDCHGVVAVNGENREITNEDVARVVDAAQVMSIPPDREIINIVKNNLLLIHRMKLMTPVE